MATRTELTPKQHKTIAALLSTPTIAAAAAAVGVGERTVHTWLGDPAFAEAYRAARKEAVQIAIARVQTASGRAVDCLLDIIDTEYTPAPPAVRLAASKAILEFALKAVEIEDIQARLDALEHAQGTL